MPPRWKPFTVIWSTQDRSSRNLHTQTIEMPITLTILQVIIVPTHLVHLVHLVAHALDAIPLILLITTVARPVIGASYPTTRTNPFALSHHYRISFLHPMRSVSRLSRCSLICCYFLRPSTLHLGHPISLPLYMYPLDFTW